MFRRRFRRWRGAARREELGGARLWLTSVLLGVGLALVCMVRVERRLFPVLLPLAEDQVTREVTASVHRRLEEALSQGGLGYGDLVAVERDASGQVTALTADTVALNRLKNQVLTGVLADLEEAARRRVPVPVGSLTGWDLLAGRGPAIQVGLLTAGAGEGRFVSDFSSAGLNQTRHRVDLTLTVEVRLLLHSGSALRAVEVTAPVAETVIVGAVPQNYVSMGGGSGP